MAKLREYFKKVCRFYLLTMCVDLGQVRRTIKQRVVENNFENNLGNANSQALSRQGSKFL